MKPLRVIDTGLRSARANMAFGAALMAGRRAGTTPDTLRFFRFPPSVLIGRHQSLVDEVDLRRTDGVEIARRLTGGGAVYLDERQICWELVCAPFPDATARICTAVAGGLARLGVEACFRPGNDIESAGRKICGTAGCLEGEVQLLHGTMLLDADIGRMAQILTPAADKLARHQAAGIADRVTSLRDLLGEVPSFDAVKEAVTAGIAGLGFLPCAGEPSLAEEEAALRVLDGPLGSDDFLWHGDADAD
ncbi:lipoate--protein ligase family protein [Telmatospirillum sp. J64-1]|uniref:lipoate--protein ligase family protein n=1 Tax=Telmatospirillum sp. J64-1 TaxID=2502183 RepID=UPI00115F14D7|nr:lipoate--protein ligase family protein [Telmatospirillum sp. J64-1]